MRFAFRAKGATRHRSKNRLAGEHAGPLPRSLTICTRNMAFRVELSAEAECEADAILTLLIEHHAMNVKSPSREAVLGR
jgi:hypothetical protein